MVRELLELGIADGNFASSTVGARLDIIGIEADYDGPSYVADNTSLLLSARKFDLVINIPKHTGEEELANDYVIRRKAADFGIPLVTNIQLAQRLVEALSKKSIAELQIKSWQEYGPQEQAPVRTEGQKELRPAA